MMSNDQQTTTTPSPLANHPNGYKNAVVFEARKKLDDLLNKDCLNNNNNNNNNDDDDDDEKEGRRTAIGPQDGSAGKARSRTNASWSEEELADGAKASAKYFFENNTSKKRKAEQEAGVFSIFEKAYKARTGNDTQRSSNGLSQKMEGVFGQLKDAHGNVLTDHCGKETDKTFEAFQGRLVVRSGKTMESDGEYALAKAFGKATQTPIPQDRDVAIALMKTKPLYNFWKELGIANPNPTERFTKISGNIPVPTQRDPSLTSGGGRRSLQAGRGGKTRKVRRVDTSNEDLRVARQTVATNEACLKDRAMKLKENELAITFLKELPDGEAKTELQAKLIANVTAMLSVPNEAPAAPALKDPVVVISDDEDENGDAPA